MIPPRRNHSYQKHRPGRGRGNGGETAPRAARSGQPTMIKALKITSDITAYSALPGCLMFITSAAAVGVAAKLPDIAKYLAPSLAIENVVTRRASSASSADSTNLDQLVGLSRSTRLPASFAPVFPEFIATATIGLRHGRKRVVGAVAVIATILACAWGSLISFSSAWSASASPRQGIVAPLGRDGGRGHALVRVIITVRMPIRRSSATLLLYATLTISLSSHHDQHPGRAPRFFGPAAAWSPRRAMSSPDGSPPVEPALPLPSTRRAPRSPRLPAQLAPRDRPPLIRPLRQNLRTPRGSASNRLARFTAAWPARRHAAAFRRPRRPMKCIWAACPMLRTRTPETDSSPGLAVPPSVMVPSFHQRAPSTSPGLLDRAAGGWRSHWHASSTHAR